MNNWISVDEKLPDIDINDKWNKEQGVSSKIIIYMTGNERGGIFFGRYYHNVRFPHFTCEGYQGFNQERITHWQPLPQPPNNKIHTQEEIDNWDKPMDN